MLGIVVLFGPFTLFLHSFAKFNQTANEVDQSHPFFRMFDIVSRFLIVSVCVCVFLLFVSEFIPFASSIDHYRMNTPVRGITCPFLDGSFNLSFVFCAMLSSNRREILPKKKRSQTMIELDVVVAKTDK